MNYHRGKCWSPSMFALAVCVLSGIAGAQAIAAEQLSLRVGAYVAPDGSLAPAAEVTIEDGIIKSIRELTEPETKSQKTGTTETRGIDYADAVLCPGLIDAHSSLTIAGNNYETANVFEPEAVASHCFDHHHRDLDRAVRGGITTALLAPASTNLVCGTTTAIKTACPVGDRWIIANGPMKMAIGPQVLRYDDEPTSRAGAMALLRRTLDQRLGEILPSPRRESRRVLADCPTRLDVESIGELAERYDIRLAVLHGAETIEVASLLAGRNVNVILPPATFETSQRALFGAAALERAGVPFAIAAMMPDHDADALRTAAALYVRYGASPEAARRAMTTVPAEIAGISDTTGSIEPGKRADLVVFSKDPLRLDARVLAVYIDGVRVHVAN